MAKFCTKCGKPLIDGKPCDCEEENTTFNSNSIVGNYLDMLKEMFKNPTKVLKNESKEKNLTFSLGSIVINAIIFGFTIHFLFNNIYSKAGIDLNAISNFINNVTNNLSSLGLNTSFNTNYGLNSGIFCLAMSILIIVLLYIMHSLVFKKKINYKNIISLVGISEMVFTVGLFITLFVSFISPLLALFILAVFTIIFFIHIHIGMIEIGDVDNNKIIYTISISIAIPVILFLSIFTTMFSIEIEFLLSKLFNSILLIK